MTSAFCFAEGGFLFEMPFFESSELVCTGARADDIRPYISFSSLSHNTMPLDSI